ncbi:MAG: beta-lactamase family protein [Ignavibacteriaceae bacterium]|nr:beta-lactamase family protein [Ignavibacteriaceae bacterium]
MEKIILSFCLIFMAATINPQIENNQLDSLLNSIYKQDEPGLAIGVVYNGEVVFKKGYGISNLDSKAPITASTNFNICSMTKQFTAYGILELASQSKLSLDDPIKKYLIDFNPNVGSSVTVRHLLTHCSGVVDHYNYVDKKLFKEFWDQDVLNAVKTVDSFYFPVGTRYRYSNTAYCLLSLIIEKVSGYSFPEFVKESIFKPLKMDLSDVIKPNFNISERAFGYESNDGIFKIADANESLFFSTMGDGGIYTSIDDYLKWILAIQKGEVLKSELIKQAQSPQFSIDTSRNISYGYGWFIAGSGNDQVVYHTGSNGGFRTIVFIKPSSNYSVVLFSNRTGIDLEDLILKINKIYKVDDKCYVKLDSLIS